MSRLDQNEKDKAVVTMGPSLKKVQENMGIENPSLQGDTEEPVVTPASYGSRVSIRRAQTAAVKKSTILGGAPPLDPEKMDRLAQSILPRPGFSAEEPPPPQSPPPEKPPEETNEEVEVPSGVGAAYHVNREMARGNVDRPVSINEARQMTTEAKTKEQGKQLSPQTIQDLEKLKQAESEAAEQAESAPLSDDSTSAELTDAAKEIVGKKELFDFGAINDAQKTLVSRERRKLIEGRLDELDIADLIVKREIQQTVPIIPDKLTYTFRTFNQIENLFCLEYLYDHPGSALYFEEMLNTCKLVCALVAVNGARLPEHRQGAGTPKEDITKESFEKKMQVVAGLPVQMLSDISVNAIWFNERVTGLFGIDNLKNG